MRTQVEQKSLVQAVLRTLGRLPMDGLVTVHLFVDASESTVACGIKSAPVRKSEKLFNLWGTSAAPHGIALVQ